MFRNQDRRKFRFDGHMISRSAYSMCFKRNIMFPRLVIQRVPFSSSSFRWAYLALFAHHSYWHPLYDKFRSNASASRCILIQSLRFCMPLNRTAPTPAELEGRQWARFCSVVKSGPAPRSHWHSMPVFAAAASLEAPSRIRFGADLAPRRMLTSRRP